MYDHSYLADRHVSIFSKPEAARTELPPIRQVMPEHRSSSGSIYDSDISRRPSVSSIASSGFHSSQFTSPASAKCALEQRFEAARPLGPLRMQADYYAHIISTHESTAVAAHTGGRARKKKREDRKQFSKRPHTGTVSSKVQKRDKEAGSRYMRALDQAELSVVCKEANPNIEKTAAPTHGCTGGWGPLKNNNIAWDVQQDGIEPSMWNKCCINRTAILQLRQSNEQFADSDTWMDTIIKQESSMPKEQIMEQMIQYRQCQAAAVSTRGEAHWKTASERMISEL
ncbi:hypothetical protein E8E12_000134 [Didymella heteroderae]|uniref:Uncharacterized protein n=1 Tax=Didymella heteroderae TaxID=1769908 RepID=A0A9P4WFB6_9PLEO|nr:hypothetical protein E8E12_000134 [Didymella heteroderae]